MRSAIARRVDGDVAALDNWPGHARADECLTINGRLLTHSEREGIDGSPGFAPARNLCDDVSVVAPFSLVMNLNTLSVEILLPNPEPFRAGRIPFASRHRLKASEALSAPISLSFGNAGSQGSTSC
jgi:hypothetical protein